MSTITAAPPVAIRNLKRGPAVFATIDRSVEYEWKGAGDPAGGDIQYVAPEVLANPKFKDAMDRRVFEIVEDAEDVVDATARHIQARLDREAAAQAEVDSALQPENLNDYVSLDCVGPGGTPLAPGPCGRQVPLLASDLSTKVPLCTSHDHLAPEYLPSQTGERWTDGTPKVAWTRVTVDPQES